jgi:hypothetical protein
VLDVLTSFMVLELLCRYSLAKVGALDTPRPPTAGADVTSEAHLALARKLASAACILLKNEGEILPLSMGTKVAVIGDAGNKGAIFGGDGSGTVSTQTLHALLSSLFQLTGPRFSSWCRREGCAKEFFRCSADRRDAGPWYCCFTRDRIRPFNSYSTGETS